MSAELTVFLDLQLAVQSDTIPAREEIERWVKVTLEQENPALGSLLLEQDTEFELTIRVVDKDEIQALNNTYRHKNQPTNVLSFPYEGFDFDVPQEIQLPL